MRIWRFAIFLALLVLLFAVPGVRAQMLPAPLAASLPSAIEELEPLPLSRPALVLPQTLPAHDVALSWTEPAPTGSAPAATGYFAYRASGTCASGLTFTQLNTTAVTTSTYTDSTAALVPNSVWCYQVTAVDSAGVQSVASNQVTATIPGPPPTPTGLTVTGVQ